MAEAHAARQPIYSIGAVARMLGLPTATIRNWEERYGLVQPERSGGGHRLYSRSDVERLRFVASRVEEGLQPADAHRLLAERDGGSAASRATTPSPDAPSVLVLLVERDPFAADLQEYLLRTEGYAVERVDDAREAEARFDELKPDLVIVELLVSGGRGPALCGSLKRRGAGTVIAVSSLEVRAEALAADADAFLQKPIEPLLLVSTVKDLLGQSAFLRSTSAV